MRLKTDLSHRMESRLARYAVVAGAAAAAAVPAAAGVVTVVLPAPIDIRSSPYQMDFNQDGSFDFFFSGFNTTSALGSNFSSGGFLVGASGQITPLPIGALIGSGITNWLGLGSMNGFSATGVLFAGMRAAVAANGTSPSGIVYGFAQFDPFELYGFAYESTVGAGITTFDITADTAVPEPATGALAALALGAAAFAARRHQQQ